MLLKRLAMIGALVAAGEASASEPNVWRACTIESVTICTPAGCVDGQPKIWVYLASYEDEGLRKAFYYRCGSDKRDCDTYTPIVHRSGAYVTFSLPQNGVVSRLGPNDMVTDVATLMDTVLISRGKCVPEPPPIIRTNVISSGE